MKMPPIPPDLRIHIHLRGYSSINAGSQTTSSNNHNAAFYKTDISLGRYLLAECIISLLIEIEDAITIEANKFKHKDADLCYLLHQQCNYICTFAAPWVRYRNAQI